MKIFGEVTLIWHIENWFSTLNTISYVHMSYKLLKKRKNPYDFRVAYVG